MSKNIFLGHQQWQGYPMLCRPLEVFGIDRRAVALLTINFIIWWQGFGSFLLGVGFTYLLYYFFRVMTRHDPQFFFVLRGAARYQGAWYDHGDPPKNYGALVVSDRSIIQELETRVRAQQRAQRPQHGLMARLRGLRDLFAPGDDE